MPHRREGCESLPRCSRFPAGSVPTKSSPRSVPAEWGRSIAPATGVSGETLRSRLAAGPLPWQEAIEVAIGVAEGLGAAHAKGIVHRDLKPENLFLTADGRVKVLDFGLARVDAPPGADSDTSPFVAARTDAGSVMGTVGYMSPEQVRGRTADARSDIFSFGCVLYEMVSLRRAFQRETAAETLTAILHDDPPAISGSNAALPADLERLIRNCLAKGLDERPRSARDLCLALRAANDSDVQKTERRAPRDVEGSGPIEAVAVLPFENVGGDAAVEYLSDALADHLILSLSEVRRRGFKVRPFTSVLRYKRQPTDVPTIGRDLRVQVVVTGTLHQQGDEIRVSVSLVDAREDDQLWGKRYQSRLGEILDLQDLVARDVAANLRLRLTTEEDRRLTRRYTEDPEAYLHYREAIHHWNRFTEEGLKAAIENCRRALARDPDYALAYVGLAQCYVLLGNLYLGPRETFAEARRCAERALGSTTACRGAHFLGAVTSSRLDWCRRGRAGTARGDPHTRPSRCTASASRPWAACRSGSLRRGQEIDPLRAAHRNELAMAFNWQRQHERALDEARKALDLDPTFPLAYAELGTALVHLGQAEEAIAQLGRAFDLGQRHPVVLGTLGYAFASAGKRPEALNLVEQLAAAAPGRFGFALPIARILAALGEADRAFAWLTRACDERAPQVIWLRFDPTFDVLRPDPRFA